MKKSTYARLSGNLVMGFRPAATRKEIVNLQDMTNPLRERVVEEIRQAHAEMVADRSMHLRPPSLVERQTRHPYLRRSVDEIAYNAVSMAAAEAGDLMN